MTAKTDAEIRAFVLTEMGLTEADLGTAQLTVTLAEAFITWTWDYADSMTHDWGTVTQRADGTLEIALDPDSSSYAE